MRRIRLIDSGPQPAALNMAIDEAIATVCRRTRGIATFRFYTWSPPALSVGYFQRTSEDVDLDQCRRLGIDLVRRPTGGKAVYHDRELTYSVAARAEDPLFPNDLHGTFLCVARGLIAGLTRLGVRAEILQSRNAGLSARGPASPACFAQAMGFEIGIDGKKLVGSAQRRWRDGFLQHGSILCEYDPEITAQLIRAKGPGRSSRTSPGINRRITSLSAVLGKVEIKRLREALSSGLERTLGARLLPSALSAEESDLAQALLEQKYGKEEWNRSR